MCVDNVSVYWICKERAIYALKPVSSPELCIIYMAINYVQTKPRIFFVILQLSN